MMPRKSLAPLLAIALMAIPASLLACTFGGANSYGFMYGLPSVFTGGPMFLGEMASFLLIFSGIMLVPALVVFGSMRKWNKRFLGKFGWTYAGTWGGGMLFLVAFSMLIEVLFPIFEWIDPGLFFLLWVLFGAMAGGAMGFSFLAKLKKKKNRG